MDLEEAISRFESRSKMLTLQAWFFLSLVVVLLGAGAGAVWFAPNITASDIGSTSYEKKIAAIKAAREKADDRHEELTNDAARDTCRENIESALHNWRVDASSDAYATRLGEGDIPTGDELMQVLDPPIKRLASRPNDTAIKIVFRVPACATRKGRAEFFFSVPRDKLDEFETAMKGRTFAPASLASIIDEMKSLKERSIQLGQLANQVGLERLQSEVGGLKEQPSTPSSGKDDLFLRLLQTSITRFGLLAVVGFFVSILVSLYRYNVRLAAFYMARADVLRLYAPDIAISDFALLAAVLSPTVEFGKAPQPPLGQLVEMAKAAKEAGK